jgi:hypothetical protein
MAFPRDPRDTVVELFIGGTWVEINGPELYGREPMQLERGVSDEGTTFTASRCAFTLDNRTGKYNPRNPVGPYYGQLGRNTPIRVSVRTVRDLFTRTVSNGWSSATTGQSYTNIGSGGTVQASDFNVNGTQGTHSVPAANAWRASYFAPTVLKQRDVDVAVTVTVPVSNVTGANIEPANIMFRVTGTPDYYMVAMAITPTETVMLGVMSSASPPPT